MVIFCGVIYLMIAVGVMAQCNETEPVGTSIAAGLIWPVALGYAISKTAG